MSRGGRFVGRVHGGGGAVQDELPDSADPVDPDTSRLHPTSLKSVPRPNTGPFGSWTKDRPLSHCLTPLDSRGDGECGSRYTPRSAQCVFILPCQEDGRGVGRTQSALSDGPVTKKILCLRNIIPDSTREG